MKKFIIGVLLVAIIAGTLYFSKDLFLKERKLISLGYSEKSAKKIGELNLELFLNNTYYETVEKALESDNYINDYLQDYMKIEYKNNDNFIDSVNELLRNKYTIEKINEISFIFDSKYFKKDYLKRYINYYEKNKDIDKKNIVVYVNIGLDNDFYTNIKTVENPNDILVLVNKYNKLPENYYPSDYSKVETKYAVSESERNVRTVAYNAMVNMIKDINKEGMNLWLNSGLRDQEYQTMLFNNSVKNNGLDHALAYSAKPRHSEHETGLAIDISSVKWMLDGFEKYKEYNWLIENAHKYGFIERYPKGKENITGYGYEPWHYRYVGVEVATIIKNENITFEEYAVKYLNY